MNILISKSYLHMAFYNIGSPFSQICVNEKSGILYSVHCTVSCDQNPLNSHRINKLDGWAQQGRTHGIKGSKK